MFNFEMLRTHVVMLLLVAFVIVATVKRSERVVPGFETPTWYSQSVPHTCLRIFLVY